MSRKLNVFKEEIVTEIGSDRRKGRRYDLDLNVQYQTARGYSGAQSGFGRTVNFSGGGVAFETDQNVSPGARIQLSIAWRVMLNSNCPLKLVVTGKVVRSTAGLVAVRMQRRE